MVNRSYNGARSSGQLNFHQLYIFQTVASHLSFSRAAEAMEITQPAVSIQVQELEKFLGVTLFHRRSRGLRITEAGEAVLAYSLQIFALSSQLMETVQEMEDLQSGRLVLGASSTPGEYVLPMIVGRFRQIYPGIRVELAIGNTRTIVQRILDREMALGMVGDHVEEHSSELEIVDFQDDEIVLVAAPSHLAAGSVRPSAEQMMELGLIAREEGSATRSAAERQFRELGFTPRVAFELGSNQAVKQAAMAGGGIGIISRLGITAEVAAGMLVVLDVVGWDCRRPLTLIQTKDRYLSPSQRAFREFLMAERPSFSGSPPTQ
ncbi:MAG: LysR family transcriptional regulator [Dehalococcoidia bacterium]|nr:LysR family transcriptional regulator [Dehalococcoidia bacterium]MED5588690.1 LysR family transcriptional regulator [Chloroflexota bacterium]